MPQRLRSAFACALLVSFAACKDQASPDGTAATSAVTYGGSCNFAANASCDEYADTDAHSGTMGQCAASGGVWTTGKCPRDGRRGACLEPGAASRKYVYTEAAAAMLMASCPAGKFVAIEEEPGMVSGAGGIGGAAGSGGTGGAGGGTKSPPPLMGPDAALHDGGL